MELQEILESAQLAMQCLAGATIATVTMVQGIKKWYNGNKHQAKLKEKNFAKLQDLAKKMEETKNEISKQ